MKSHIIPCLLLALSLVLLSFPVQAEHITVDDFTKTLIKTSAADDYLPDFDPENDLTGSDSTWLLFLGNNVQMRIMADADQRIENIELVGVPSVTIIPPLSESYRAAVHIVALLAGQDTLADAERLLLAQTSLQKALDTRPPIAQDTIQLGGYEFTLMLAGGNGLTLRAIAIDE